MSFIKRLILPRHSRDPSTLAHGFDFAHHDPERSRTGQDGERKSNQSGNLVIIGLIALLAAGFPPLLFAAESLKLESYYPSPSGIFKSLRVQENAYLATGLGNVGIGTSNPEAKLHIAGPYGSNFEILLHKGHDIGVKDGDTSFAFLIPRHATDNKTKLYYGPGGFEINSFVDANTTATRLSFDASGNVLINKNVGIGGITPDYILDMRGRMRVRQKSGSTGSAESAGLWLYQNTGSLQERAFIGMANDSTIGLYGNNGAGWGIAMDITGGNVGIGMGTNSTEARLHVRNSVMNTLLVESETTADNESSYIFAVRSRVNYDTIGQFLLAPHPSPQNKLRLTARGNLKIDGTYYSTGQWIFGTADIAEAMVVDEKDLEEGDVVDLSKNLKSVDFFPDDNGQPLKTVDPEKLAGIAKAKKGSLYPIGVLSTQPASLLSGNLKNSQPVALAGRVPTKVSLENGSIEAGDRVVASSTPGHAMKATKAGHAIGVALEPFDGKNGKTGKIMVLIQSGWWPGDTQEELADLRDENEKLKLRLDKLERRLASQFIQLTE